MLGSIATVGDALDNALAESFVDSYKTELIADRVWRTQTQVELATVRWVSWFNNERLHSSLGDIPPVEFEQLAAAAAAPIAVDGRVAAISPRPADGLTARRLMAASVDLAAPPSDLTGTLRCSKTGFAQAAPTAVTERKATVGLSELQC